MRALDRKLLRDLWRMKGQAIAIGLVLACGVATFVMSLSMYESLQSTLDTYYERYHFAQVFSRLKRAPESLAERMAEIRGVARVQTRVVVDVNLDVAGMTEPAVGRLVSLPKTYPSGVNDIYLRQGRYPELGRRGEALVHEAFALAHNLVPGDTVTAIINGRRTRLRVVGIALAPEFIYLIRPGDILPDDRRFGVFWMDHVELSSAFDMRGAFNDVALILEPGASEPEVLRRLDRLTEPYGGVGAYGRSDQQSHRFIENELNELRGMARIVPMFFLAVAALLLNMVIHRLVRAQREQIAALKAFGYTHWEVGLHYLKLVGGIALAGLALGTAVGVWFGQSMTEMYAQFFHFPVFQYHLGADVVLSALGVSSAAAVIGALGAVRQAIKLPPAEAMRPEPPASFRPTVLERLGLQRFVSPAMRMVLRNLERQPVRALFSMFGLAMAVAILVLGSYMEDSVNYVIEFQFFTAQRYDLALSFVEPVTERAVYEVLHLPGVRLAEPFRAVPVRLWSGHRSRLLSLQGLEPHPQLYRLIGMDGRTTALPPEGLVISSMLGDVLDVGIGDVVTVEVMEGERPWLELPVAGLLDDFAGLSAYIDRQALHRALREGERISGAYVTADTKYLDELHAILKQTPKVAGVAIKRASLESFQDTIARNLMVFRTVNVVFACIIAFGVVFSSARIALADRSRELSTLRVIGFTRAEVSLILLGELTVLVLAAIPLGLLMGYGFAAAINATTQNETFRIPLIVEASTYAFATVVTLTAALVSGLVVRRDLDRLDLVAVLKSKE